MHPRHTEGRSIELRDMLVGAARHVQDHLEKWVASAPKEVGLVPEVWALLKRGVHR